METGECRRKTGFGALKPRLRCGLLLATCATTEEWFHPSDPQEFTHPRNKHVLLGIAVCITWHVIIPVQKGYTIDI